MKLQHISSSDTGMHTIDTDLLTLEGWTLDAGCRDFTFSDELRRLGQRVIALDPAEDVDPGLREVIFMRCGLSMHNGSRGFKHNINPMMAQLEDLSANLNGCEHVVRVVDVWHLLKTIERPFFDCLKLDVEGEEYLILRSLADFFPPAKQISVEFHGTTALKDSTEKLLKSYRKVWDEPADTLFVLK